MSGIGGLSDLTSDKAPLSPGTGRKSVRFSPKSPRKNDADDKFDKVMKRPLSMEAAQAAMDTMQDTINDPANAHGNEKDRASVYWMIQNYKRAFKDTISFNNRVTRDSPLPVMKKELESVQNQIGARNSKRSLVNLTEMMVEGIEYGSNFYNPTSYQFKGLAKAWKDAVKHGHMEEELTELSIKYGDWLSQGPELRFIMGFWQVARAVGELNKNPVNPKEKVSLGGEGSARFADL